RSPGQTPGRRSGHTPVRPRVHQYRHEHSSDARDGHTPAPAQLWWILSGMFVDCHGPPAKRVYVSKRLLIMSDRNFSRRRRGGMRFRPSGGLGHASQKPDREATEARAEATGGVGAQEKVTTNGISTKSNALKTSPRASRPKA